MTALLAILVAICAIGDCVAGIDLPDVTPPTLSSLPRIPASGTSIPFDIPATERWIPATGPTNFLTTRLQALGQPGSKALFNVVFSNCDKIKGILRQEYGQSRPDLSKLALDFMTREITIRFSLSEAAELLPTSRFFSHQNMTIVYMHGFTESPKATSVKTVSNAFLTRGEFNFVALDSSAYIGVDTLYFGATTNVRYIGEQLGELLASMLEVGSKPSAMYLIGHSLGSHIAGFTAKRFTELTGQRVGRITGLDPAGPCFTYIDDNLRLKVTDADFVDTIHTDAGVLGIDRDLGHANFYPNGGSKQPGCLTDLCNHNRAWAFFADSVLYPSAWPSVSCGTWRQFKREQCDFGDVRMMGFECPSNARGRYYLQTNGREPYGRGYNGLYYNRV